MHSPPMPTASGTECVRVLVSLGWMPIVWTVRECHLQNNGRALTVPLVPELPSERVSALATLAGISPYAFVDALEKIRTGRFTMRDAG